MIYIPAIALLKTCGIKTKTEKTSKKNNIMFQVTTKRLKIKQVLYRTAIVTFEKTTLFVSHFNLRFICVLIEIHLFLN